MTKFQQLKDQLQSLEQEKKLSKPASTQQSGKLLRVGVSSPKWLKMILLGAFILSFFLYMGNRLTGFSSGNSNTVQSIQNWTEQPDEELLAGMGNWMEEMGYVDLNQQDLIELRHQGVTATFISRMHDLGLENLTLDDAIRLRKNDVSATFATMMKELGYTLEVEDLIELRQHNVTAYYTSNLHDLGYTDITKEELVRLKDTGVNISEIEQLISENSTRPTVTELIKHYISNQ